MVDADLARLKRSTSLMRAFVTGLDGFVGQWLVRELHRRRCRRLGRVARRSSFL